MSRPSRPMERKKKTHRMIIDVGGVGDCFFRSVSHQLYGNSNYHMSIRTAGVQFMRDNLERFIESNTENSRLRYLNNMCIQGA